MATKVKKKTYEKRDHKEELAESVATRMEELLEQMERGDLKDWKKSWFVCPERPYNPVNGTKYRGVNVVSLMMRNFPDPRFYLLRRKTLSFRAGI